jgi:hypothetical protein
VVVVAPATAVAGAATTTRFRKGNVPGFFSADGRHPVTR